MANAVEVSRAFETYGFSLNPDDDVAAQCLALCRQFNASADEVAVSWDAFYSSNAMKMSASQNPTSGAMEAFRAHFARHVASDASRHAKTPQRFYYNKPDLLESLAETTNVNGGDAMEVDALAAVTPGRGGHTPGAKTAAAKAAHAQAARHVAGVQLPATDAGATLAAMAQKASNTSSYAKRPAPRMAKAELNPGLAAQRRPDRGAAPVAVEVVNELERDARYMRHRVSDQVEMLETRLNDFATAVERAYPGLNCRGAVYAASQDDVTVVGRVVCDSEGRLNDASVQLEASTRSRSLSLGSIATSQGMRVRLELRDMPTFSLFPGQIVCVQGQNPSGHCLVARRIIAAAPPPPPASPPTSPAFGALSAVVASGPFTCAGDLSYEPFTDLLAYTMDTRPDVLVLMGPFVDAEHRAVRGEDPNVGPLDVSFEEVFAWGVRDRLEKFVSEADAVGYNPAVVLVPSVRDATHDAVFPQPPLLPEGAVEAPHGTPVVCVSNPGTFTVNGVRIVACTQDVLRHLSAAEAARTAPAGGAGGAGCPPTDRMARLAAHLPGQRSAYPLFPPAPGACLDAALGSHLAMEHTPDVLLLPSDLNPFAKVVSGAGAVAEATSGAPALPAAAPDADAAPFVALNPGRLAKGNIGGTLAHVYVSPGTPDAASGAAQPHALHTRTRVDIVRI